MSIHYIGSSNYQRQEMVVGTLALLWYRVFLNEAGYTAIRCVLPRRFFLNANGRTHGRTDGRTDGQTLI